MRPNQEAAVNAIQRGNLPLAIAHLRVQIEIDLDASLNPSAEDTSILVRPYVVSPRWCCASHTGEQHQPTCPNLNLTTPEN